MGHLIALAPDGPFSTGSPVGDATSYGVAVLIAITAWKLFRWYRADVRDLDAEHDAETAKLRRNVTKLLAHVTVLAIEIAKLGGNVPDPPTLEE